VEPSRACRLCRGDALDELLVLDRSPANISRLLRPDELSADRPVCLRVYRCSDCGFVQVPTDPGAGYYDDYLMTVSHSAQMRAYQQGQARDFVDRFGLAGRRVIEVGCGDGHYMDCLRNAGAVVSGIEPSARFRVLAEQRGFRCFAGYVGRQSPVPEGPYAGFVTRQVLEHVEDLRGFLAGVRRSLEPGGVGLVEVPSLEQALENGRFYDFFPDHVNYFSARTLRLSLEMSGFEVEDVTRGMRGEYDVACVRLPAAVPGEDLQQAVADLTRELRGFLEAQRNAGRKVAIWGAGGKGLATLAATGVSDVAYVIDNDPHKQGRYTPVSHLRVVAPETLKQEPVGAIVLTALPYRDEIIDQLRKQWGFAGPIAVLGRRIEVITHDAT